MLVTAAAMIDPMALALVVGGSLAVAALRSTRSDMAGAFAALRPMVASSPVRDAAAARIALRRVEEIAGLKGIACADQAAGPCPFVRRAALKLADAQSADGFAAWARADLAGRAERHDQAAAFWRAAADAAPSMGMAGTVIGLIGMFTAMDDPARLGPAMALAMLTTLYGIVVGTILFGPAAARLERLSRAELVWQAAALARLEALARAEAGTAARWLARRAKA